MSGTLKSPFSTTHKNRAERNSSTQGDTQSTQQRRGQAPGELWEFFFSGVGSPRSARAVPKMTQAKLSDRPPWHLASEMKPADSSGPVGARSSGAQKPQGRAGRHPSQHPPPRPSTTVPGLSDRPPVGLHGSSSLPSSQPLPTSGELPSGSAECAREQRPVGMGGVVPVSEHDIPRGWVSKD